MEAVIAACNTSRGAYMGPSCVLTAVTSHAEKFKMTSFVYGTNSISIALDLSTCGICILSF